MHYLERYPDLTKYSNNQMKLFSKLAWKKFRKVSEVERWWRKFHSARRRRVMKLSEQQNHRCCYCSKLTWVYDGHINQDSKFVPDRLSHMKFTDMATADHIIPVSAGGSERIDNMIMACMKCNTRRHDRDPVAFWQLINTNLGKSKQLLSSNRKVPTKKARRKILIVKEVSIKRQVKHSKFALWLAYLTFVSPHFRIHFADCLQLVPQLLEDHERLREIAIFNEQVIALPATETLQ